VSAALLQLMRDRIATGLQRHAITTCSKWAESYRVMGQPFPGKWSFQHHPWAREMHDCEAEMMVGQKGAQLAFTETALNKVFYNIDVHGKSVLYILPASTPDASDFSTSRFDPALEMSPHLQNLFSDVKNIGHKRSGTANLFIRGSRSRSQLKSLPVAMIVADEVDEMNQDNLKLAFERTSGQVEKQIFLLSTPTVDNQGINIWFRQSSQDHYFFKCPCCSRYTELTFPECLVITAESPIEPSVYDSYLKCKECKHRLEHETKKDWLTEHTSKWVATHSDRTIRGFHVNQLYSMTVKPADLAISYLRGQTNPGDEQEFYNSKLGLTHEPEGSRITDAIILDCQKRQIYKKQPSSPMNALITMGVDVGKWLHFEIDQWFMDPTTPSIDLNTSAICKVLFEGKVAHFEELDTLIKKYMINYVVIDANPERRKALEFAQRFWGHVKLCFYGNNVSGKQINIHEEDLHTMTVDRTSWMDVSLSRFHRKKILLPIDLSLEYKSHVKAPVRIYRKDKEGNAIGAYVTGNEEDHFAHARTYSELALLLAAGLASNQSIKESV
jgi:hypothetical protein